MTVSSGVSLACRCLPQSSGTESKRGCQSLLGQCETVWPLAVAHPAGVGHSAAVRRVNGGTPGAGNVDALVVGGSNAARGLATAEIGSDTAGSGPAEGAIVWINWAQIREFLKARVRSSYLIL